MDWNRDKFMEIQKFMEWTDNRPCVYFITGLTGNKALAARTKERIEMAEKK